MIASNGPQLVLPRPELHLPHHLFKILVVHLDLRLTEMGHTGLAKGHEALPSVRAHMYVATVLKGALVYSLQLEEEFHKGTRRK